MNNRKKGLLVGLAVLIIAGLVWALALTRATQPPPTSTLGLSEQEITAAIAYGVEHKEMFLVEFQTPWTVSLGYRADLGQAIIHTPFLSLALLARNAALTGIDTQPADLVRFATRETRSIRIETHLYGHDLGFDREYQGVVLAGEQEFPALKSVQRGYDQAREYTITSHRDFFFPAEIMEGPEFVLQVIRPDRNPLEFTFDLTEIR